MNSIGDSKLVDGVEINFAGISEPLQKIINEIISYSKCDAADGPKHDYYADAARHDHHRNQA